MDYTGVVKDAWRITWRYKILWLFGLFASFASGGGGGGGGGGNGLTSRDLTGADGGRAEQVFNEISTWASANLGLIAAIVIGLFVVLVVLWVFGIAATGGLIHLTRRADSGGPVTASEGWSVGFSMWGRVFLVGLLLALPILMVVFGLLILGLILLIPAGMSFGSDTASMGGAWAGVCGLIGLAVMLIIPISIAIALLGPIALRHAVLADLPAVAAIKTAWRDLRVRFKDIVIMALILLGLSLVFAIVVAVPLVILAIPAIVLGMAHQWVAVALIVMLAIVVLTALGAIWTTFDSAAWTVFYLRMYGAQSAVAAPASPPVPFAPAPTPAPAPAPPAPVPPGPADADSVYAPPAPPMPPDE